MNEKGGRPMMPDAFFVGFNSLVPIVSAKWRDKGEMS